MKKTFLSKRNALLSTASISRGVVVLGCVLIVLTARIFAPNFFWSVFAPVFAGADALAAQSHSFLQSFGNTAALASQNDRLSAKNVALASENQALVKKIEGISALVNSQTSGQNAPADIIAGVVARPPESPYDTLVLAAGARAGVALGMEVFGNGGVPLGVISSVLADFSRATLFSSPGMNTAGWVGHANVPIVISGAGAGAMQASAPRSANIAVGDVVFAPGPGMLPIGTIVRVDSDLSSPSVALRIQPALNLFSLGWVALRDTGTAILSPATSTSL